MPTGKFHERGSILDNASSSRLATRSAMKESLTAFAPALYIFAPHEGESNNTRIVLALTTNEA
jgi:hypothetical protein